MGVGQRAVAVSAGMALGATAAAGAVAASHDPGPAARVNWAELFRGWRPAAAIGAVAGAAFGGFVASTYDDQLDAARHTSDALAGAGIALGVSVALGTAMATCKLYGSAPLSEQLLRGGLGTSMFIVPTGALCGVLHTGFDRQS